MSNEGLNFTGHTKTWRNSFIEDSVFLNIRRIETEKS